MSVEAFLRAIPDDDEILEHHGTKGMKWGVRHPIGANGLINRSSGKSGSKPAAPKRQNESKKTTSKSRAKPEEEKTDSNKAAKFMSDEELKKAVNRLNLERQFQQYSKELNPPKSTMFKDMLRDGTKEAGKQFVKEQELVIAGKVAKFVAKKLSKTP